MSLTTLAYVIGSRLPPREARDRVAALLSVERVRYALTDQGIQSTRTPIGLNFQSLWFSQRNWVGLNPFAHVSSIAVECAATVAGATNVNVQVDRTRAFYIVSPYLSAYILAPLMPLPAAIIAMLLATGLIWFTISYVAGRLLAYEIRQELNGGAA